MTILKRQRLPIPSMAVPGLLLGLVASAPAQSYTVTDLGSLNGGRTVAWSLNLSGEVTGFTEDAFPNYQAFRWTAARGIRGIGFPSGTRSSIGTGINDAGCIVGYGGSVYANIYAFVNPRGKKLAVLGDLGGGRSWARDINNLDQIVGESKTSSGEVHAVLWDQDVITDIGAILGATTSQAEAISNTGFVVGTADGESFLYRNGTYTILPTLGSSGIALGVNDAGVVVGSSLKSSGVGCTNCDRRAVLWKNGLVIELGVLAPPAAASMSSTASGINSYGQVVGYSTTSPLGSHHGFIWDPRNGMRDLNDLVPPGWNVSWARAINDSGQIAAIGSFGTFGVEKGLLLTPNTDGG